MGRKTFESIGRPLPNRLNIVISRQPRPVELAETVKWYSSLDEAIESVKKNEEAFVIGGAEIYKQALPLVDRMYLTRIEKDFEGDAYFPSWDESQFKMLSEDRRKSQEANFSFQLWERKLRP